MRLPVGESGRARLSDDVGQLVCKQTATGSGIGRVLARPESDVTPHRVCVSAYFGRGSLGQRIAMDADAAEIASKRSSMYRRTGEPSGSPRAATTSAIDGGARMGPGVASEPRCAAAVVRRTHNRDSPCRSAERQRWRCRALRPIRWPVWDQRRSRHQRRGRLRAPECRLAC